MPDIYFEDLQIGASGVCAPRLVPREEIIAFARDFDPQPFHLDAEAAKATFVGELIASGWHTCSLAMRIMCDGLVLRMASMGAPGVEEVKWLRPVRPGDTLTGHWLVEDTRVSRSRPEMGFAKMTVRLVNQTGETVLEQRHWAIVGRRGVTASANGRKTEKKAEPGPELSAPSEGVYFDELVMGETRATGSYGFTKENIVGFARQYDPQPFHVDEDAARASHFGSLCASGWHTGSACMRKLIDYRAARREEMLAQGIRPPAMGSSPGFKDLVWHKPVYVGDTVSYASTLVSKRKSLSRPGWGLVFSRNTGTNQKGELVYEFTGSVFMETRGP